MAAVTEYCAPDDLGRFGINADALEDLSVEDVQKPAIRTASRFIDSYLRSKFTLPLQYPIGDDVKRACAIIAVCDLMSARGYRPEDSEDDTLARRYREVVDWLKQIAAGHVVPDVLDSSSGGTRGTPSSRARVVSSSQRGWSSRGTGRTNGRFEGD